MKFQLMVFGLVMTLIAIVTKDPTWLAVVVGATVFPDVGAQWVIDKMDDSSATTMNRWGWGTGAGTSGITDTTLFTEASETRATATLSQVTTSVTGDTFQADGTITATGTKTITNGALFDAASVGNMLIKGDFTGIPLLSGDSIQFIGKLQAFR